MDTHRAMHNYMDRTEAFRQVDPQYGAQNRVRKVSNPLLSIGLNSKAYEAEGLRPPSMIMAHSTRVAAATMVFSTRVMVNELCKAVTWAFFTIFVHVE